MLYTLIPSRRFRPNEALLQKSLHNLVIRETYHLQLPGSPVSGISLQTNASQTEFSGIHILQESDHHIFKQISNN